MYVLAKNDFAKVPYLVIIYIEIIDGALHCSQSLMCGQSHVILCSRHPIHAHTHKRMVKGHTVLAMSVHLSCV